MVVLMLLLKKSGNIMAWKPSAHATLQTCHDSWAQTTAELSSLVFSKQKQNGKIKGRSCADGRPQRKVFTKAEVTSPTAVMERVFITVTIDAYKNRYVVMVNLPGAFLHTDTNPNNDAVHMVMRNQLCELVVNMNSLLYQKFVIHDKKGKMLLCVEL